MIFLNIWDKLYHMKTRQKTEEKVFIFMEKHHMLETHDKVVVGVSGGADSVCLLFVLLEYRKKVPFSLAVVHVNHGIRKEAKEDECYVEILCRMHDLPFYPFHINVKEEAKKEKCSEEEAGRNARYQAFAQVAEEFGADKIAVAHNCNDRSETMLFHLFRGSGIKGLGSIRPVREHIIRPILCLERREVEAYLKIRDISYCQDATNETDDYTRNRIRHHILPYVEKEIVSGCVSHMAQTADMLSETEDYLEQQTVVAMQECVRGNEIEVATFLKQHQVIRQRILYAVIISLTSSRKDISYVHIRDLLTLFTEQGHRSVCLPFGIVGRRQYGKVILEQKKTVDISPKKQNTCGKSGIVREIYESKVPKSFLQAQQLIENSDEAIENSGEVIESSGEVINNPGEVIENSGKVAENSVETERNEKLLYRIPINEQEELEFRLFFSEGILADFPSNQYTKWFDYDKIIECLEIRTRQTGDYFTIMGKNGETVHKSLKDYMIAEKIPKIERNQIPLIADGQHIIWLIGYRISEYYKISRNTKHILQVKLIGRNCGSSETEEKDG